VRHDTIRDASYTLQGALWGANCNTLCAASELCMYSDCLKYIPEHVREQFLSLVADAVVAASVAADTAADVAAQKATAAHGEYCLYQSVTNIITL
jgi:hypothetical protein